MIPKIPEEAVKCIESWRKYCPQYEIKEWNESNFDINACMYSRQAAEAKKWAFVSDYARFKILYEEGGLYFDTDVELIKPIDDIIATGPFMGCEAGGKNEVASGLGLAANAGLGLAAGADLEIYKEIIDHYESNTFLDNDGNIDATTVVARVSQILKKHGFKGDGNIEEISGIFIYPPEYFCPMNYWTGEITLTENTRSIHHYSMSWKTENQKHFKVVERRLKKQFGHFLGWQLYRVYYFFNTKILKKK